ncbi:GCN5-related N-acetyltransferase [Calothrix sp. NIES-4101]|nr:GCN5-related N-acetyltransferase [Calothrix sp. NIES-4101]
MTNKIAIAKQVTIRKAEIKDAERITHLCKQLEYSVTQLQIEQCLTKIKNDDSKISKSAR